MIEQQTTFDTTEAENLQQLNSKEGADAAPDTDNCRRIRKRGCEGIFTTDQECKMETLTTTKATHVPPKSPGVSRRGIRAELLEKQIYQMISEKVDAERKQPTHKTDYSTTTQRDFCADGFIPHRPQTTQVHDYKNDQAITFWSDNYQRVQGVTPTKNSKEPFKKSTLFSTPISERLDELELQPDD